MGKLDGKVALVTGGASGIGRASALALAAEGASVMVSDVDVEGGRQTAAQIESVGGKADFLSHDVSHEGQWLQVVDGCEKSWGGLHILVNNAGIGISGMIVEMPLEDFQRQNAINVDGVFLGVKTAIPLMMRSGGGSIINISSVAGLQGAAGLAGYSASKGAVRLFTKSAALECQAMKSNIRVNSVHPGIIDTPIWEKIPSGGPANAIDAEELARRVAAMDRPGSPEEVARGVVFLASDDASYMTGSELVIDGGLMAGGKPRPRPEVEA